MRPANPKNKTEILETTIPLFAKAGYSGVAMRKIAKAVGINAASLYHHFPDKQSLYIAALKHAFSGKARRLLDALATNSPPEERLLLFIRELCELMDKNPDFSHLVQREILEGDETRLRLVGEQVFQEFFNAIAGLSNMLAPACNAHMLAISIIGLVAYHYQTAPIRFYLPGGKKEHNDPDIVARHVTALLLNGIRK
jgi:TetR/AcrR family transcriptional regulator